MVNEVRRPRSKKRYVVLLTPVLLLLIGNALSSAATNRK
jgi:hypothetical protein